MYPYYTFTAFRVRYVRVCKTEIDAQRAKVG
jgi:hypothetical protein